MDSSLQVKFASIKAVDPKTAMAGGGPFAALLVVVVVALAFLALAMVPISKRWKLSYLRLWASSEST